MDMSHYISDQLIKVHYRYELYYAWVQMLLQMGPLLRLGPKVITDGTFITLGSIYYTCAFNSLPRKDHGKRKITEKAAIYTFLIFIRLRA